MFINRIIQKDSSVNHFPLTYLYHYLNQTTSPSLYEVYIVEEDTVIDS